MLISSLVHLFIDVATKIGCENSLSSTVLLMVLLYNTYGFSLQVLGNEISISAKVRSIWPAIHKTDLFG